MLNSKNAERSGNCRHTEAGYSLLMVVFLVATSLILSAAVVPNLLTQGRREREEEMVWRGEQYERAIGLFYTKFGRYPTKVDDLVKQTNGVRFLRKAYTDPMNKDDGTWRFIYVGPNGQLVGSAHSQSLMQSVLTASTVPGASPFGPAAAPPPPPGTDAGNAANGTGQPGQQSGPQSGQPSQQPGQVSSGGLAPNPLQSQLQPFSGDVIGGNIIGIGSKVKQSSLLVYKGYESYDEWEFIWNPIQQGIMPGGQAPMTPGPAGAPGQTPGQQAPPAVPPPQSLPGPFGGGPPGAAPQPGI